MTPDRADALWAVALALCLLAVLLHRINVWLPLLISAIGILLLPLSPRRRPY